MSLSYNSANGNLTVTGNSSVPTNNAWSSTCEGQVYLFRKTFFDFTMSISKTASGWALATGQAVINTGIFDDTKKAIVYIINGSGYGDSAYIKAEYNPSTGQITVSGNTYVYTNGTQSVTVTGVVLLV